LHNEGLRADAAGEWFQPGHGDLHRIFANPKESQPAEIIQPFFDQFSGVLLVAMASDLH
jgi:hypothetical protein